MDFCTERTVKEVRKPRRCDACGVMILIGEPATVWAGLTDGDFGTCTYHPDCRAAEAALNALNGTRGDEWIGLRDLDGEDYSWLLTEHPTVAARKGVTVEKIRDIQERHDRSLAAFAKAPLS